VISEREREREKERERERSEKTQNKISCKLYSNIFDKTTNNMQSI